MFEFGIERLSRVKDQNESWGETPEEDMHRCQKM